MTVSNFKAGEEFLMDGLAPNGNLIRTKVKLIAYNGMNKYIVASNSITMLADGNDKAYAL